MKQTMNITERLRAITLLVVTVCILVSVASAAPDPETVFRNPPQSAKTGVWWHWMGCNVTKDGIVKDLDWFQETGIGAATIFGMADICTPWATQIKDSPTQGLIAFTPEWWKLVRFACQEAEKRGIELGIHNCPGYTSTGGPWIPPRLAMRELVFNITNAETQISLTAHAAFPVQNGETGAFTKPEIPCRRADLQEIAVVEGIRIQHIPMGSFTQPNQWEVFGLECDKMNPEAVAFHLDHVLGEMKKHVGDQIGRGLKFVLLDSYEAGKPTWTPRMREEFTKRRGYDPLPFLPILGGFHVTAAPDANAEKKFKADYDRTIKDLYRDVLFRIMHEKLQAVGLEFACEPYTGPFDSRECAAYVDRLMTEFWFNPTLDRKIPGQLGWNRWIGPGGKYHNIVEAEAFTGQPVNCQWTETPYLLKAATDTQFDRGINRMTLHTCPLQPWDDEFKPGKVMGRWGTHFGRNQTWAKSGRGWYRYLNRCQALLQWGEPSTVKIGGHDITPKGTFLTARARTADSNYVFFVVNHSDHPASMNMSLPDVGKSPEWFDPVTGRITPLALVNGRAPIQLAPCGSGFLVLRKPADSLSPNQESDYVQRLRKPFDDEASIAKGFRITEPWRVSFGEKTVEMAELSDWTKNKDATIKYFSGTAIYRTKFSFSGKRTVEILSLGNCNGQIAKVLLNEKELDTLWCEPYEILLPNDTPREGENTLEIEFTNVWANRLIGDEQEPADCAFVKAPYPGGWYLERFPEWFKAGIAARPSKGRKCFTDWNYFTKDSPLTPSGLLGPVRLFTP
ncbi:MAG: hypothetical protein IKR48_06830 [Kiritimatiellae bacterium]|nr:hypothetical protein [Kiritimatiellia bacterium]